MDPVTALVSGHAAGKLLDYVGSQFKAQVIERWAKRRAENFFEEFCREVELELAGTESAKLDGLLPHMLKDETCSEVLFDAYRRVSLAKSRDLGPRIIGIITAELVVLERTADSIEDALLAAAEMLSDEDLLEFTKFVRKHERLAADESKEDVTISEDGHLRICWSKEQFDSNWDRKAVKSIGPLDLDEEVGRWASRAKSCGILSDGVQEQQWDYDEDSERHIDEPGTVREITRWLYVLNDHRRLADLVERVARTPTPGS